MGLFGGTLPVRDGGLPRALQGELAAGSRPGDGRAGTDRGARADFDRRDQFLSLIHI